ncbi:MAG: N-acetylmannosamine-6-phosphate 2-epimerase [Vulcanimicrobiaceae bacterium]
MSALLDGLRGGLIVSCQANPGSAIDDSAVLAAFAAAAQDNGAVAVRMAGIENLRAARRKVTVPVIGLIKRRYEGYEPYITPTQVEVRAILSTGAQIVAFDATGRPRPGNESVATLIACIHAGGALAMADCATAAQARIARASGADITATTLCGYTKETKGVALPAFGLLRELREAGGFVICEGGIHSPQSGRAALEAGADAIVVGTAITNTDWLVAQFANALGT